MTPPPEPRTDLPWNESNPEWWKVQVEDKGDLAWLWLVNEWAARGAEAAGAPLREARDGDRFPCGDCGQMVTATERHTWADCRKVQP